MTHIPQQISTQNKIKETFQRYYFHSSYTTKSHWKYYSIPWCKPTFFFYSHFQYCKIVMHLLLWQAPLMYPYPVTPCRILSKQVFHYACYHVMSTSWKLIRKTNTWMGLIQQSQLNPIFKIYAMLASNVDSFIHFCACLSLAVCYVYLSHGKMTTIFQVNEIHNGHAKHLSISTTTLSTQIT